MLATMLTVRRCEWCGSELPPRKSTTCTSKCRGGRHRWLHGIGNPPSPPPWVGSPLHDRMGEQGIGQGGEAKAPGPRSGMNARSGLQVSVPKMRRLLMSRLNLTPEGATALLREALSDKQRARLEDR